VAENVM